MRTAAVALLLASVAAAQDVRFHRNRDGLYFEVTLPAPPNLARDHTPRLVPQDEAARCVVPIAAPDGRVAFAGKWAGTADQATFLVLLPCRRGDGVAWTEDVITLQRANARLAEDPKIVNHWADGQMAEFRALAALAPDFSFYDLAQVLTFRRYGAPLAADFGRKPSAAANAQRQLFETYAGGAAVGESLQLGRVMNSDRRDEPLEHEVASLPGIALPEHPWAKMMGDARPAPEPLTAFVPADNYYVHFRGPESLLAFGELLELWGANLIHGFEFQSRDPYLRARYERQLCLPTVRVARALPADLVRGIAITGSDPYLADGSDVTVLVRADSPKKLLEAVDPFLHETRLTFRDRWRADRTLIAGVPVETFVTPQREVSLYRAVVGDVVIFANSPVGMARVLDARSGVVPTLEQSLDFRYMRTVFRADDKSEDGFAFLPDAFIRRLMGPADKIKQKRRAEALGALALMTDAALYAGWDSGRIPADNAELYAAATLVARELSAPDGTEVTWDGRARVATSRVYNTLTFATPLIELPIDRVTASEKAGYEQFRTEYLRLWNRYFDPIGLRFQTDHGRVRMETYALPLVQSDSYRMLRQFSGGGTTTFDPAKLPPATLFQALFRTEIGSGAGDWLAIRLDDDPTWRRRIELLVQRDANPARAPALSREIEKSFWHLPLTVGFGVSDVVAFGQQLRTLYDSNLKGGEPTTEEYRGSTITRLPLDADKLRQLFQLLPLVTQQAGGDNSPFAALLSYVPREEMPDALYQTAVGGGYYLAFRADSLKKLIDHVEESKGTKPAASAAAVNAALFLNPAARETASAVNHYLEWQTRRRALPGTAMWLALYRSGAVPRTATEAEERSAALHWLGFEPVSPDGSPYRYDRRLDEVVNVRHGSPRVPATRETLAVNSPFRRLLERFATLRADLKFREDGLHTVVTFEKP